MRKIWIDSWKGILITLVVLGHAVGTAEHFSQGYEKFFCSYIYKSIYMFHMPAFFCVAGYLWKDEGALVSNLIKKSKRLLIPYFFFGFFSVTLYLVFQGGFVSAVQSTSDGYYEALQVNNLLLPYLGLIHAGGVYDAFRGNSVLWFLPCMFSCSIVMMLWDLCCKQFKRLSHFSFVVYIILLILSMVIEHCRISGLPWMLTLVPYYLTFMIVGRVLKRLDVERLKRSSELILFVFAAICILVGAAYLPDRFQVVRKNILWYFIYYVFCVLGCAGSLSLARLVSNSGLAALGAGSLAIMLCHKYFLLVLQIKFGLSSLHWTIISVVVATMCSYAGYLVLKRSVPIIIGEKKE